MLCTDYMFEATVECDSVSKMSLRRRRAINRTKGIKASCNNSGRAGRVELASAPHMGISRTIRYRWVFHWQKERRRLEPMHFWQKSDPWSHAERASQSSRWVSGERLKIVCLFM